MANQIPVRTDAENGFQRNPQTVETINYKQGRWKKSVKDSVKYYTILCRVAVEKGKSVAMTKTLNKIRVIDSEQRFQISINLTGFKI